IRDLYVTGVQTCALPILRKLSYALRQAGNGVAVSRVLNRSRARSHSFEELGTGYLSVEPIAFDRYEAAEFSFRKDRLPRLLFSRSEERRVGKECGFVWCT